MGGGGVGGGVRGGCERRITGFVIIQEKKIEGVGRGGRGLSGGGGRGRVGGSELM